MLHRLTTHRLEVLNLFTGSALFLAGMIYLSRGDVPSGLNWLIFGSMYLVMDDYKTSVAPRYGLERMTHAVRAIFSIVGAIGSIALLVFLLR